MGASCCVRMKHGQYETPQEPPLDESTTHKPTSPSSTKDQQTPKTLAVDLFKEIQKDSVELSEKATPPKVVDRSTRSISITGVKEVVTSKQIEAVSEFRKIQPSGKVSWTKTHFIFVIDCSGSMKGARWESVKSGYKDCLTKLQNMKEVLVSAFTFDDKPNPFIREMAPKQVLATVKSLPFTMKGTNYKRALAYAIYLIKKVGKKDYLSCVVFLSDGQGGYPTESVSELNKLRKGGKKTLFYTIACETNEEAEMIKMAQELNGEHYKLTSTTAAKVIFSEILGIQKKLRVLLHVITTYL
eukprot:TRINITY_DN5013_c0_g1_i1.p1 TRINITY_DN5013_c0_g1~~TRINITY_DN5013_c0_g1_i1.p1  ORF type:complete len:334 (-),score=24.31 TRINITY_DN5013_c0_g1_i1:75-971(-)